MTDKDIKDIYGSVLVTFTPENLPAMKPGLSLTAQAAFKVAVAEIMGETITPKDTPIIGATEVSSAKRAIENTLGIPMANPHAVIMRYGDHKPLVSTAGAVSPRPPQVETPVEESVAIEDIEAEEDDEPEVSIKGMLDTIASTPTIPLAIVGDAGTGKTSIIREWALANNYELNLFLANTASEDDVAGAITPDHTKKMAVAYPLEKLHRSTTHKTVLFLDELNTARREVQDPLLTLIQDRCLPNGTPLHPETIIVTAINPSATYNNHEMSPQLRNRFMWFYHTPSEYDWLQWLLGTNLGKTPAGKQIEAMVLDGTLRFDKDEAFTQERNEFTTPRSVYNLLKISGGSIKRLKAFAENLVAPTTAEAIRLHGYTDKDTRGNSFFEERKKEATQESKSEYQVMKEWLESNLPNSGYDLNNGLDVSVVRELMAGKSGHVTIASTPMGHNHLYPEATSSSVKIDSATGTALEALGGTSQDDQNTEANLMADIQARMSMYGGIA